MSRNLTRTRAQALLDAPGPSTPDDEAVRGFLDELRREYGTTVAPEPQPALVARLDGHRPLHALPDPLAPPDGCLVRRRTVARPIAAALVGGTVVLGGLAGAGALPAPVQRATADLGRHVGLHLPDPTSTPSAPKAHARARVRVTPPDAGDPATTAPNAVTATGTVGVAGPAGATGATLTVPPSTAVPVTPVTPPSSLALPLPVPGVGPAPPAPPELPVGTDDGPVGRVLHDLSHR